MRTTWTRSVLWPWTQLTVSVELNATNRNIHERQNINERRVTSDKQKRKQNEKAAVACEKKEESVLLLKQSSELMRRKQNNRAQNDLFLVLPFKETRQQTEK